MAESTQEKTIIVQVLIYLSYFLISSSQSFAFNGLEIGGAVAQLVPHTTKMLHIKAKPAPIIMTFFPLPWTDSLWHNGYASLTVHFHDNGNARVLGKSYGISITWNFDNNNSKLHFKLGTGLAMLTKKYDFYYNQNNVSIGSRINNVTYVFSGYNFSHKLTIGIGVIHYSSGALSMPNLGLNYPFAMITYRLGQGHSVIIGESTKRVDISRRFIYELGVGISANMPPGAPSAPVLISSLSRQFRVGRVIYFAPSLYAELNLRAMLFYHLFRWQQSEGSLPPPDRFLLTLRTGPEMILSAMVGRVVLSGTAGWYIHNKVPAPASLFNRLYLTYWVTDRVGISIMVKAHLMAAEFTSLNLTIKI